ncbi:hypothetical protein J4467_03230 [Candidatus Woesearchaeota archaeon]|nr:hypothetical protein [Candidatus Woesearchaeota archaeon]
MRNALILGLGLLVSNAEANSLDKLPKPDGYNGFTVTVEYDPNGKTDVIERFYGDIMDLRPELHYYKIDDSRLPSNKLPAVIVRCNEDIVYDSYGRTPPSLFWNVALNYFTSVLDKEKTKCF